MNRRTSAGIAVVVALAAGLALFVQQRALRAEIAAERAAADAARQQAGFQGRVVYVESSNGFCVPLLHARINEAGGRNFVVGQAVNSTQYAGIYAGGSLWLPVSDVIRMTEFADFENLRDNQDRIERAKVPGPPSTR